MPFFDRFTRRWASTGVVAEPTDSQADAGFAHLGPNPPTVEEFNALFQWLDDKDGWLYAQIAAALSAGGQIPSAGNTTNLVAALRLMSSGVLRAFKASAPCIVPQAKEQALVMLWGAGGGGGGSQGAGAAGSGGGAGEFRMGIVTGLTYGQSVPVTIGTAGTGGAGTPTDGLAGGNTSFGAYMTAIGGGAGIRAINGLQVTSAGVGGEGGSGGLFNISGRGGGLALNFGGVPGGGIGGSPFMGSIPGPSVNSAGISGSFPGGGGNGGAGGFSGGTGGAGFAIVLFI